MRFVLPAHRFRSTLLTALQTVWREPSNWLESTQGRGFLSCKSNILFVSLRTVRPHRPRNFTGSFVKLSHDFSRLTHRFSRRASADALLPISRAPRPI